MTTTTPDSRLARVSKFSAVGLINTALDFLIFNVLFAVFGLWVIFANIISTTVAMIFSFFANRNLVFKARDGAAGKQAIRFLLVTAFGLYVLQLGIIHILTSVWTAPLTLVVNIANGIGLHQIFSERFIRNNGAKAIGTVASLAWNYVTYKRLVFHS